jgi:uncharacterized protein
MNPVYALQKINTWWKTGEVDHIYLHKRIRSEFTDILKSLGNGLITNIVGPTGVGKTSLLYHTVNHLIKSQISPLRVIFFGGDEMTLFGEHRSVGSLLEMYATDILHENLFAFKEPVYILIDDIQLIDDWQIYLLNYRQKAVNIKFIIAQTHSNNNALPDDAQSKISVMPLTQPQFAEFYGALRVLDIDLIRFKSLLPGASLFGDPSGYYDELSANIYALSDYKPFKTQIMDEYLLGGGYLAYFSAPGIVEWQTSLLSIIDRALYRDVGAANFIKSPQKLKRLLYIIAAHGALEQSFGSVGRALYVDTSTIIGYITTLCESGFAGVSENFSVTSGLEGRVIRKNKRLYICDTGVHNALLRNTGITADYGAYVTTSCLYMAREYVTENGGDVFFWKDGNRSVDLIISVGDTLLPVAISYQREYADRIVKNVRAFMRSYDAKRALVITKDVLKNEDGIFFIPYWMI